MTFSNIGLRLTRPGLPRRIGTERGDPSCYPRF